MRKKGLQISLLIISAMLLACSLTIPQSSAPMDNNSTSGGQTSALPSTSTVIPSPTLTPTPMPIAEALALARTRIKHIVIIMQENRSFDSYFGTYPGADGLPRQNGQFTACVKDPKTKKCIYPYHDPSYKNLGGPHSAGAATADVRVRQLQ